MKKFLLVLSLYVFSLIPSFASVSPTIKEEQHRAALTIVMINPENTEERAGCSATAVAPHVILTAEHCNVENGLLYLNQNSKPFTMGLEVKEKYFDKNDHMLLVVPGAEFKHFVNYDASKVRKSLQGEHIYFYGNPDLMMDQYREGYASGFMNFKDSEEDVNAAGPFMMFAVSLAPGDSGSAVFSEVDGQLIGVTTWGIADGKFLGSYPLQFTQAQIDQAEGMGNFVYIPDTRPRVEVRIPQQRPTVRVVNTSFPLTVLFAAFLTVFTVSSFSRYIMAAFVRVKKAVQVVGKFRIIKKV
jgi:hypothetical protein